MSAAAVLPLLHAHAAFTPVLRRVQASADPVSVHPSTPQPAPEPQLAFYRKYTEAILRRYLRMSLEAGRVPSLLGRELFRGKVTSYRVESFEDAVIFCHDVERCLQRLNPGEQFILDRIALKQYTVAETVEMLGTDPRTVIRRYCRALDALTATFLEVKILEMQKRCQAPQTVENVPSECNQSRY